MDIYLTFIISNQSFFRSVECQTFPSFGALTAAIREEGLNVPSRGCRITSGQNDLPGVLIGALLRPGEPIEFHRPNTEYMENYFSTKAVLRDGKLFLPDCPGLPVRADLERLEADGLLNEKQTLLPKTI